MSKIGEPQYKEASHRKSVIRITLSKDPPKKQKLNEMANSQLHIETNKIESHKALLSFTVGIKPA